MIDAFVDLVNKRDPDILTGYNILAYDNPYLDTRLKRRLREWKSMSRLIDGETELRSFSWGSSAYGHNDINLLTMDGRIMIDLLPIIRRDYKLKLYNLNFVGNYFVGRSKLDVNAREMFETYELHLLSENNPNDKIKDHVSKDIDKEVADEIRRRKSNGTYNKNQSDEILNKVSEDIVKKYHVDQYMETHEDKLICSTDSIPNDLNVKKHAMAEMKKVVDYCVVDSDLVLDIFEKIHCWIALIEMANVMGVTPVELFTRGQQLRVLSQVYDEASTDNIVIDERTFPKTKYTGGFVYEPNPGLYHNIPILDFKSLYPTVMIANNICPRTFVPPEMMDKIPDEMCNVIEWDEEVEQDDNDDMETADKDNDTDDNNNDSAEKVKTIHYRFKFIKQEHMVGILPRLLIRLINERDEVRRIQKKYEKGSIEWIVLERRQLALKVSCNSMYGALGAQKGGKIPLPDAAACVTAKSREAIKLVNSYLISKGYKIVYGDSVTGDTPIRICVKNLRGSERLVEIQNLWKGEWKRENGKEYSEPKNNMCVWSDKGFTPIKYIMRHKTNKRLYRIYTDTGIVTVTEDHSLIDPNGNVIKPSNIKVGDRLMTKSYNEYCDNTIPINDICRTMIEKEIETQMGAASLYDFLVGCGFSLSLDTKINNDGKLVYVIVPNNNIERGVIRKIEDLGYVDDYVYDLETENHHFAAGVGELVVHNTDSSMPDLNITDPSKAYEIAKEVAAELSTLFPPPMLVEDEEVVHTMLCIRKKMYLCIKMAKDGTPIWDRDQLKVKGVVPARRDNCPYHRNSFIDTAMMVLKRTPMIDTFNFIIDMCLKLVLRQVPWQDLVIIKGLGSHYKSASYPMKIFSDELCKIGKPASPGDRLEYVIVKSYGVEGKQLMGYKMRLPSTYLERLNSDKPEQIDYNYYMEKVLMNCIQKQLFQIGYNKELKDLEKKYLDSDQEKVLKELRKMGYTIVVDQVLSKFEGDKKKAIDYLINETDLKKIVSKLVSYHIKKRGRIVTRINKEPIKMMVKIIQAREKCMKQIRSLVHISEIPKVRPVKLNIVKPGHNLPMKERWAVQKAATIRNRVEIVK
jgi:DNA polymerase elongation subunit (family B)